MPPPAKTFLTSSDPLQLQQTPLKEGRLHHYVKKERYRYSAQNDGRSLTKKISKFSGCSSEQLHISVYMEIR